MSRNFLEAAASAARAGEQHIASGCGQCRRGARLAELCPEGQHQVVAAARRLAPDFELQGPYTPWEINSERRTPRHRPDEPVATTAQARAAEMDVPLSPDELTAMAERIVQAWGGRAVDLDDVTATIAGAGAQLARVVPLLADELTQLRARVEELEACRCWDPTTHAPGCAKAIVHWQGHAYPAAVWYRDRDSDWWAPVSVDTRGCLVLLLDGDTSNAPVPLDEVQAGHGPVTTTAYGSHVPRSDLPDAAEERPLHL